MIVSVIEIERFSADISVLPLEFKVDRAFFKILLSPESNVVNLFVECIVEPTMWFTDIV